MLDKLAEVEKRYVELESLMSDPQLLNQQREYSKFAKERAELEEIVACFREWRKVEQEIQGNRQLLEENDEGIRELAKEELVTLRQRKEALEHARSGPIQTSRGTQLPQLGRVAGDRRAEQQI